MGSHLYRTGKLSYGAVDKGLGNAGGISVHINQFEIDHWCAGAQDNSRDAVRACFKRRYAACDQSSGQAICPQRSTHGSYMSG